MREIKNIILFLITLVVSNAYSQLGNEWINSSSSYVKVEVKEDGFYRIDETELSGIGVSTESIDPRSFRLLRRGTDWSISVSGEQDGVFNSGDYIEFYGLKNDAEDESGLYLIDSLQFQKDYSMYTDTASYFLTWGGISGERISQDIDASASNLSSTLETVYLKNYTDYYDQGNEPVSYIYNSEVDEGEGWLSASVGNGSTFTDTHVLTNNNLFDGSGELEIVLVGANNNEHQARIIIESTNGKSQVLDIDGFSKHEVKTVQVALATGFLDESFDVTIVPEGVGGNTDFLRLSSVKLTYKINNALGDILDDFTFQQASGERNIISTSNTGHKLYSFSETNAMFFVSDLNGSTLINNPSANLKNYIIRESNNFNRVAKLSIPEFNVFSNVPDYVIVSHSKLWDGALEFEAFKASTEGGSHDAKAFDINHLYNTYTYGDRNPLAIRRMVMDMIQTDTPSTLLFLGRGLTPNYVSNNNYIRKVGFDLSKVDFLDLVPTWGTPGSDVLFTANLGSEEVPLITTGRFPVDESDEVGPLIEKITEHNNLDPIAPWRKNVIHLSGGANQSEAVLFANYVEGYRQRIEGEFFGGNVSTFSKETDVPIEFFNISEQLNDGLSLITYIGHSSPDRIEIDLGNVSTDINGYRNKGKYPILYLNGCNAGDMFSNVVTSGEDWLMTPERGAIGVFSHASYGYSGQLNAYTELFYETAFSDSLFYGKTMGEIHQETINKYRTRFSSSALNHTQMTQWTFFGDPSIRFFSPDYPELSINSGSINLENSNENERLTAKSDSVKLSFTITNTGKVIDEYVDVCILRAYNDLNSTTIYDTVQVLIPSTETEVEVTLFNELEGVAGVNVFEVYVDCSNMFTEYDETNNILSETFDLPSSGVDLTYPYPYSILPDGRVQFVVESQDFEQGEGSEYRIQVAKDFNFSEILIDSVVSGGNVAFLETDLIFLSDTSVYYWRSKISDDWAQSSFSVIENKNGWGQFEYGQIRDNTFDNIVLDDTDEAYYYDSVDVFLKFETAGKNHDDFMYHTNIILNDRTILNHLDHVGGCRNSGIVVLPFDGASLNTYSVDIGTGYTVCGPDPKVAAHFNISNSTLRDNLRRYLDSIPVGDFIILMTTSDSRMDLIDESLDSSLANFGNPDINSGLSGLPYVFIGKKGADEPYYESYLTDDTQSLLDSFLLSDISNFGTMTSRDAGVGVSWSNASWSIDQDTLESILVQLKEEEVLLDSNSFMVDAILPDSLFDGVEADFLSYSASFNDAFSKSISSFDFWSLSYDPVPEGVVLSTGLFEEETIYQGDSIRIEIPFVNVSPVDFSGVIDVEWSLQNLVTGEELFYIEKLDFLNSLDTLFFELVHPTSGITGINKITVSFNTEPLVEQNLFNNTITLYKEVKSDEIAPVTEIYIDNELALYEVSASSSPEITIVVTDNNQFIQNSDTLGLELFIAGPCAIECEFSSIYFSDEKVSYFIEDGSFKIIYLPEDLEEGRYELKVKGVDAFGNVNEEFSEASFVVKKGKELSYFIPYPSPFSSSMRFAYTLTGYIDPEEITIQVLSSEGTLVKEITKEELGPLKVGDNLTEWEWDGTDENGKLLSNGVYLYRMIFVDDDLQHLETEADQYFKKGWGTIEISR